MIMTLALDRNGKEIRVGDRVLYDDGTGAVCSRIVGHKKMNLKHVDSCGNIIKLGDRVRILGKLGDFWGHFAKVVGVKTNKEMVLVRLESTFADENAYVHVYTKNMAVVPSVLVARQSVSKII